MSWGSIQTNRCWRLRAESEGMSSGRWKAGPRLAVHQRQLRCSRQPICFDVRRVQVRCHWRDVAGAASGRRPTGRRRMGRSTGCPVTSRLWNCCASCSAGMSPTRCMRHSPWATHIEFGKLFVDAGAKDAEVHGVGHRSLRVDRCNDQHRTGLRLDTRGHARRAAVCAVAPGGSARSSAFRPERWKRAVCVSGVDCFLGEGMMSVYGICLEDHAA